MQMFSLGCRKSKNALIKQVFNDTTFIVFQHVHMILLDSNVVCIIMASCILYLHAHFKHLSFFLRTELGDSISCSLKTFR